MSFMDNGRTFGALVADLYKAFDCLHHELLIAKVDAYGFDLEINSAIPFKQKTIG